MRDRRWHSRIQNGGVFQKLHVAGLSGSGWMRSKRVRGREKKRERERGLGGREARVEKGKKREEEKRER